MKVSRLMSAMCVCFFTFISASYASPAKFDIPGDFPGTFQIDFLGTDFKLGGVPSGSLSTESVIQFSVGSESSPDSGVYNISASSSGFNFLGFEPVPGLGFDIYGAGTGTGTFDTNTGHWTLDMPTLFVNVGGDHLGNEISYGTRVDFHLTTENVLIPASNSVPSYMTTSATPMVLDESSLDPWGDLNLVAGGVITDPSELSLAYDFGLINDIGNGYTNFILDPNIWMGTQYEFDIYGNDPLVNSVPVPAAVWLFGSGLLGLIGIARRKKV